MRLFKSKNIFLICMLLKGVIGLALRQSAPFFDNSVEDFNTE